MNLEEQVIAWLGQQSGDVYLVGGCVRDRLLGRPIYDLDVAVAGGGLALARRLANHFRGAYFALDAERDTGRAILDLRDEQRLVVDVAGFRGPDLAADLADRDFTINALAAGVRNPERVIDHHGGLADLEAGLIRPVSDACISSDPLRALRGVRQAAELDFALVPEARRLIRRDGGALVRVAGERVRDEVARVLALPNSASSLDLLDELGLLTIVLPELAPLRDLDQSPPHHLPVLAHSLDTVRALEALLRDLGIGNDGQSGPVTASASEAVPSHKGSAIQPLVTFAGRLQAHLGQIMSDARPRLVVLKLAALVHDTGKAAARSVDEDGRIRFIGHPGDGAEITEEALRRLRFNRAEVRLGGTIVRHHMRPLLLASQDSVSSRAVYRFFRDAGDAGVDVLLHALADQRATVEHGLEDGRWPSLVALTARMLADYWERPGERVTPPPLISGKDLVEVLGLKPGRLVGQILESVREAQVSGEVGDREEALAWVRELLRDEL